MEQIRETGKQVISLLGGNVSSNPISDKHIDSEVEKRGQGKESFVKFSPGGKKRMIQLVI